MVPPFRVCSEHWESEDADVSDHVFRRVYGLFKGDIDQPRELHVVNMIGILFVLPKGVKRLWGKRNSIGVGSHNF